MPNLFKGVVKLTEEQYKTLLQGGSFDFNGQTIVYDKNTLYVTDYSIDDELNIESLNPVTNRAITLAIESKAGKEEIPANVVTTNTEQDIEGNKNFVGNVTKNGVNLATVQDIKVTDTLDHQYDDYALSVKGGMVLNDKITTLIENVNGRVQSFSLDSLNDLLNLFNITTNTDEAMEQYPVSSKNITYMGKDYTLKTGDIFLIVDTDVPDYWFSADTMMLYKMETMKIDLTNYATIDFVTNSVKNKAEQSSLDTTNKNVATNTSDIATLKENQKTKLSELESDSTHRTVTDSQINMWDSKVDEVDLEGYATEEYVDKNGGKIDKIFINDVEQEIVNKEVHLEIDIPETEQIKDYYKVGSKLTGIDLNTIVVPGNYGVANDCSNMPVKENGTLFVGEYDKGTYVQQLFIGTNNKVYTRNSTSVDNSTWSEWLRLARSSDLNDYLAKAGGTMTGQIILSQYGFRTAQAEGYQLNDWGNLKCLSSSDGAGFNAYDYNNTARLTYFYNTGEMKFTKTPNVNGTNLALSSDLANYLPLSGGKTITGSFSLDDNTGIRSSDGKNLLSWFNSSKVVYVSEMDKTLYLQGKNDRPTYINGSGVSTNLALYADIPSLSGYATETYVNDAIEDLIGSAPDTLDTLEELAAAISDNKEIVDALGDTYVPLSGSKAMTGQLKAPQGIKVGSSASGGNNNLGLLFGDYAKIGCGSDDSSLGIYANGLIAIRPYYSSNNNNGIRMDETTIYPTRNATMDLGTSTYKFKNIYASGITTTNTLKLTSTGYPNISGSGTVSISCDGLWDGSGGTYYFDKTVFRCAGSDTQKIDLGSSTSQWKNIYLSGSVFEGGTALSNKYLKLSGGTIDGMLGVRTYNAGMYAPQEPLYVQGDYTTTGIGWVAGFKNPYNNSTTDFGTGIKIRNGGETEHNKWCGIVSQATDSYANSNQLELWVDEGTARYQFNNNGTLNVVDSSNTAISLKTASQVHIKGTAASKPLWVRGIQGCLEDGVTEGELHLNYSSSQPVKWGTSANGLLNADGSITAVGGTMTGNLNMNNCNITGVNNLVFADPGADEGIEWVGGNGWKIYEATDTLGNAAGNLQFVTGSTRRMTLDTSGILKVTERISSPLTTQTHLNGNQGKAIIDSTASAGYNMLFRMKSTNGVFTGGAYNSNFNIYYTADSTISAGTNTITKTVQLINESGDASFGNNVSVAGYVNASSDIRLKENIIDIDEKSLKEFIENTPIKAFNYKENGNRTVGVIAQDIDNLEIDGAKFTSTNEDGYLQVHETKFVYLLWNYCQQLNKRIKELESKVK